MANCPELDAGLNRGKLSVMLHQFVQRICIGAFIILGIHSTAVQGIAGDWPMWRSDAGRTAASAAKLPERLHPAWSRVEAARKPVWDDPLNHDLMAYDRIFEPVVKDGRLVVGFNDSDKVMAFDIATGDEIWRFYTDAPVRFPAVMDGEYVYFTSDDGCLYCVTADNGSLKWKFRGGPSNQKAIGNERVVSAWPARGAPVIADGTVYFAASIWPFMGTFIYALDAETGEVQWENDGTAASYIKQPHSAPSFAGVAPQGNFVVVGDKLIVPGGRSVPAVFDRNTGELDYYYLNEGGKGTGGALVLGHEDEFYVHTRRRGVRGFELKTGKKTSFQTNEPVLTDDLIIAVEEKGDAKFELVAYERDSKDEEWKLKDVNGSGDLILAGDALFAAGGGKITRVSLSGKEPRVSWQIDADEDIVRLLAASERLIAVTLSGKILVYSGERATNPVLHQPQPVELSATPKHEDFARQLVSAGSMPRGFVLWFGLTDELRLREFVRTTDAQVIVVFEGADRLERLRAEYDRAGLLGKQITFHTGDVSSFQGPAFVAKMIIVDDPNQGTTVNDLRRAYVSLRPYGGKLICLRNADDSNLLSLLREADLEKAEVKALAGWDQVERVGALTGSGNWTHQYGDIANSVKSDDSRVKLPLGILWFGGSSNMDVLPRHGHGPPEQVIGGRLFIQGMNSLNCRDVYTGQVLWKREFEDLGTYDVYYDETYKDTPLNPAYNQVHIPGANGRGTNYVATEDAVYLLEGDRCHVIDVQTGETIRFIQMPDQSEWGFIGVYGDLLLGGIGFANYRERHELTFEADAKLGGNSKGFGSKSYDRSASRALIAFDRHTGKELWRVDSNHSFIHNGIVAGDGRVYCLDKLPRPVEDKLKRRGLNPPDTYRVVCFDAAGGAPVWEQTGDIFGTWLGYSKQHNVLLLAGARASDRMSTEVGEGMAVYDAVTGDVRWRDLKRAYSGPCILHNDTILTNANSYQLSAGAFNLLDGTTRMITNPITQEEQVWQVCRAYGCNNIIASENFLTFRSGAAGYYDLNTMSGTGNLGGFKSGCTSNLVVANGILNAPDYTRTCSCSYQNQTSLGLVHMPEMDMWTVNHTARLTKPGKDIHRVGVNFGAPGDRIDESGTLWIDYPIVGGDSPDIQVNIDGESEFFCDHTLRYSGESLPWVAASGVQGFDVIRLPLSIHVENAKEGRGFRINSTEDDAEEQPDGEISAGSSDLELTNDGDNQVIGLRFSDVTLTKDSIIEEAYLQFTCDETNSEPTNLTIAIVNRGDAKKFKGSKSISESNTMGSVRWSPPPWTKVDRAGEAERSPSVAHLVQQIIQRDDWKPGNAMAFVIRGDGKRVAQAFKGSKAGAPRLFVKTKDDSDVAPLAKAGTPHTVRLVFAEPNELKAGERVFDILINGRLVEEKFDIVREAGQPRTTVIREFRSVLLGDELELRLPSRAGTAVLSGVEVIRE